MTAAILSLWLLCHPEPVVSPADLAAELLSGLTWPDWDPWTPAPWRPVPAPWQLAGRFDAVGGTDGPWKAPAWRYEPAGWCVG